MRIIGYIIAGCIALAVLRIALAIVFMAFLGLLLWGFIARPKETIGCFCFFVLAFLLDQHFAFTLIAIAGLWLIGRIAKIGGGRFGDSQVHGLPALDEAADGTANLKTCEPDVARGPA